jgi:DNA-binding transcriptional regulator YiaG
MTAGRFFALRDDQNTTGLVVEMPHVEAEGVDFASDMTGVAVDVTSGRSYMTGVDDLRVRFADDMTGSASDVTRDEELVMPLRKHKNEGIALQRIRHEYELGQTEMAKMFEVSVRTLQRWELGHRPPTRLQLTTVVAALLREDNRIDAESVAAMYGASLEALGFAPAARTEAEPAPAPLPPAPPAPRVVPPREAIELSLYMAADELEMRAATLRAPFVCFLKRLGAVTCAEAAAVLAPVPAAVATPARGKKSE